MKNEIELEWCRRGEVEKAVLSYLKTLCNESAFKLGIIYFQSDGVKG